MFKLSNSKRNGIRGKDGSNFGPSQNRMHKASRDNISFDDFLGHLRDPPVIISKKIKIFKRWAWRFRS